MRLRRSRGAIEETLRISARKYRCWGQKQWLASAISKAQVDQLNRPHMSDVVRKPKVVTYILAVVERLLS